MINFFADLPIDAFSYFHGALAACLCHSLINRGNVGISLLTMFIVIVAVHFFP